MVDAAALTPEETIAEQQLNLQLHFMELMQILVNRADKAGSGIKLLIIISLLYSCNTNINSYSREGIS